MSWIILAICLCGPVERIESVYFVYGSEQGTTKNVFDSDRERYVRDMVCDSPVVVQMTLSDQEYQLVLLKAHEVNFFELPADSRFVAEDKQRCLKTPFTTWLLRIRTNQRERGVSWDDRNCGLGASGERAMQVAKVLLGLIEAQQQFKALPKPRCSYL